MLTGRNLDLLEDYIQLLYHEKKHRKTAHEFFFKLVQNDPIVLVSRTFGLPLPRRATS